MAEYKYTWDDIIIDPTSDRAKEAVGKECYFSGYPNSLLGYANEDYKGYLSVLKKIETEEQSPFLTSNNTHFCCIIVKKEEPYSERENKWIEENDLKNGDYVKVLKKAESYENGWNAAWVHTMDNWVGKTLKVLEINPINSSICLECNDAAYCFPYFVLEKTEKLEPKYVPFESTEEFIKAFYSHTQPDKDSEIKNNLYMFGMWLMRKDEYAQVFQIENSGLQIGPFWWDWKDLFNNYTFLDGAPCGKKVGSNVR